MSELITSDYLYIGGIMAEQNFYINRLLSDPARFADFFNAQIYGGRQVLQAADLQPVKKRTGIPIWDSKRGKQTIQRERDVVMKAAFGVCFAILGLENQNGVHYAMPVRSMLYDALDYTMQIKQLQKAHEEAHDKLADDEFLSGITCTDRVIPVVTFILYYGKKPWDGSKSLYDLMGFDEQNEHIKELENYIPNYRINLISIREMEHLESFQSSLQYVFGMLKYSLDKDDLYHYIQEHRDQIKQMDEDSIMAALSLLGEKKRVLAAMENQMKKEEFDMCQAIDDLILDGEKRGEERGQKRGEKRGEARLSNLILQLLNNGRQDLLEKVATDQTLRNQLYKEYHL